jgi:6-phosphofructokinase 1
MIESGSFGQMACLKGRHITSVPIEDAIRSLNLIDPDGEMVRHAEALGIMLGR